jgi:hypothetical protein
MLLLLAACTPTPTAPDDCVDLEAADIAAVYTDFVSGALGFLGPDGVGCPVQAGASVGGDPLVRADEAHVYVVKRSDADAVSAYALDDPSVPVWEAVLPTGTNAHDLVPWRDRLWLTSFGTGEVLQLDPADGTLLASAPVGETLSGAAVVDDQLWVADQRFALDRRVEGALMALDEDGEVVRTEPIGHNPRITADGDGLLVATGYYAFAPDTFDADLVDGALVRWTPDGGASAPLLEEAGLEGDLHAVIPVDGGVVAVVVDRDSRSRIVCQVDGVLRDGPSTPGWYIEGVARGDDVLLARRSTLLGGESSTTPAGWLTLDPRGCTERSFTETTAQPYGLAALR